MSLVWPINSEIEFFSFHLASRLYAYLCIWDSKLAFRWMLFCSYHSFPRQLRRWEGLHVLPGKGTASSQPFCGSLSSSSMLTVDGVRGTAMPLKWTHLLLHLVAKSSVVHHLAHTCLATPTKVRHSNSHHNPPASSRLCFLNSPPPSLKNSGSTQFWLYSATQNFILRQFLALNFTCTNKYNLEWCIG